VPRGRRLRLAYLTTEYPKVSHTFIRREILEMERRGHEVLRLAVRDSGGAIADPIDVVENQNTFHLLSQPKSTFASASLWAQATRPERWGRALAMAAQMGRLSDRGFVKHGAYLAEAALVLKKLIEAKVEHLHVHFGTNSAAVARLVHCLGGPSYSMTVHGPDELDAVRGFSLPEKVIDSAFTVAISDFGRAQLCRWVPYEQWDKIHVVRCSVGEEFFVRAKPIDPASRTLLSIGRLSAQKGQLVLIAAVAELARRGIDLRVVLAGDGEMRGVIEERIRAEGLTERVHITGFVDEDTVRALLCESRALVQPSFAEGLPVVIMEALAMKRPVISTMVAGIPELVKHGENGWLVTAGNASELANALTEALAKPADLLDRMGERGADRVRAMHFVETEGARLEGLFSQYVG
jgi:colanic acid/amylovoran biosynthesis glycosyltransferase